MGESPTSCRRDTVKAFNRKIATGAKERNLIPFVPLRPLQLEAFSPARIHHLRRRKQLAIKPAIAGDQLRRLHFSVRSHQKICQNPLPFHALFPVSPPRSSRSESSLPSGRFHPDTRLFGKGVAFRP